MAAVPLGQVVNWEETMIVRNWMKRDPVTVTSDTPVSKAKRILVEHNLRALPVVDDGRLRGVVTRVSCLRAAEFVARSEDPHEFSYFTNRLKVKDLMVRNPLTVDVDDPMEVCLRRGQEENISQFPVLENGNVVGLVSAHEVFFLAAQMLGTTRRQNGITVGPLVIEQGTLARIEAVADKVGAVVESLFSVPSCGGDGRMKVILRFTGAEITEVAAAVEAAGYEVLELCPYVVLPPAKGRKARIESQPIVQEGTAP